MSDTQYDHGEAIPGTPYRFLRTLAEGGQGVVVGVEHGFLGTRGVMKLLHAELAYEADLAERMAREARILLRLRHPNIVQVRDGGITAEDPPRPFFVMEALHGMSLRTLLERLGKERRVGVMSAIRIMCGVLDGLHHAHCAGVIHRDIKPDNIFLHRTTTDVTVPKVIDFGIAHISMGARLTGEHFIGTPRYASPEQLRGEPITRAADIYSAGLVFWELVTGREPFPDERAVGGLIRAHFEEKLPRTSLCTSDGSRDVDFLVDYLTDKDPTRRPPTAVAAAIALRELHAVIEQRVRETVRRPPTRLEPTTND